jgi:hypothetical protein
MNPAATLLPDIERRRLRALAGADTDDPPGFICWHTDCYRFADGIWQVVWSQATEIRSLG